MADFYNLQIFFIFILIKQAISPIQLEDVNEQKIKEDKQISIVSENKHIAIKNDDFNQIENLAKHMIRR